MQQFYTKQVSKEVFEALLNKEYPVETYFAFKEGNECPEYRQKIPTYAEVLDWLIRKGVKISIGRPNDREEWFTITDKSTKLISTNSFTETMNQTILFVLEFI